MIKPTCVVSEMMQHVTPCLVSPASAYDSYSCGCPLTTPEGRLDPVMFPKIILKHIRWASLVVQWLRIFLPRQGTRVQALVQEDSTCRGATKPVRCNY